MLAPARKLMHTTPIPAQCAPGGVRVDVVDLFPLNARVPDGGLYAGADAEAVRAWVGHVVGIAAARGPATKGMASHVSPSRT